MSPRTRHQIGVLSSQGSTISAELERWSEPADRGWHDYHVHVSLPDVSSEGVGSDVFAAFQNARVELESLGYRFLCYGASLREWPSGMARDMRLGLQACKLDESRTPAGEDLVEIFASGDDVEPCTVSEQNEFADRWRRNSAKRKRVPVCGLLSRISAAVRRLFG